MAGFTLMPRWTPTGHHQVKITNNNIGGQEYGTWAFNVGQIPYLIEALQECEKTLKANREPIYDIPDIA